LPKTPVTIFTYAPVFGDCFDVEKPVLSASFEDADHACHTKQQCCQVAVVTAIFLKCGSLKKIMAVENL
jgi:hypothetical protein